MQIRCANRKDEIEIQTIALEILGNANKSALESNCALKNLETNYFGKAGVFFVVEAEGKIIAFAGAKMLNEQDAQLHCLGVKESFRRQGIGKQLMHLIIMSMRRLDFQNLVFVAESEKDNRLILSLVEI